MERYEKYKDSGIEWIGEIPEHWETKRLKYMGYLYGGLAGKSSNHFNHVSHSNNKPFVPFTNICNNIVIDPNQMQYVVIEDDEKQNTVQKGDLFFMMSSENFDDVGKSSILLHDLGETYLNSFCKGFRFTNDRYYPSFINYLLLSKSYRSLVLTEANGYTRINLKIDKINDIPVIYPTNILEQTSIATYLDRKTAEIDQIIANKQKLIALYEEEKQAMINQAVTKGLDPDVRMKESGVEWLGEIPEHWEVRQLRSIVQMKSGEGITSESIKESGEFPVYGGNGLRGYFENYTHMGDYVLIGRQGALCGNINYATGYFWASEHAIVCTLKGFYNTKWLGELLRVMNLNQYSVSAAQPGLSVENLKALKIPVPPLNEQQSLVAHIEKESARLDAIISKFNKQIALLQEYRTTLISEVVTGKVKVHE